MTALPCSIFFHNYYGDHAAWLDYFINTLAFDATLYYNINEDSPYNTQADISVLKQYQGKPDSKLKKVILRQSSNKGKDIGGKLVLMDASLRLSDSADYGLFLHDKKSPYKANNETWKKNLLAIAEPAFSGKALALFTKQKDAGVVTAAGNTKDEFDYDKNAFSSTNAQLLASLQQRFTIRPTSYKYVTGTMFWFRMSPMRAFFLKHAPLVIRKELEYGNVMDEYAGTNTHSWERLLCWIFSHQHYSINTI